MGLSASLWKLLVARRAERNMEKASDKETATKRLQWAKGRMAFVAQQDRIREMLAAGDSQLGVYRILQPHLNGLSYSQFSHHVRTCILLVRAKLKPVTKGRIVVPQQNQRTDLPRKNFFPSFEPGPKVPDLNELF